MAEMSHDEEAEEVRRAGKGCVLGVALGIIVWLVIVGVLVLAFR